MRWNSSFFSLSNNEEIFFQYDVESLHIYAVAVPSCQGQGQGQDQGQGQGMSYCHEL